MEAAYRIFMYLFPYGISVALYVWMFRRVQRVPTKLHKNIAIAIIIAGFCYTLYSIAITIGKIFTDDNFHFQIMIATVIVLFLASIVMAFGEPEK